MDRYKINIEYKGTNYVGWQKQKNGESIQSAIENAIMQLTNQHTEVFGAGRTDAGVHALNQVAHFDLKKKISPSSLRDGLNKYLRPQPIAIVRAEEASNDFHARFSAKQRQYFYKIVNRRPPLTIDRDLAWVIHKKLNIRKMQEAAISFVGKNNLSAFRSINCQSSTTIKTIDYIKVRDQDNKITISVGARSFLHSQVRIMVGTLVYVGEGKISPEKIKTIIKKGDRENSGPTAPADGLFLENVLY